MQLASLDPSDTASSSPPSEFFGFEALLEQRLSPGILVIAPPMRILHMNDTGWNLIGRISEEEHVQSGATTKPAKGLLPSSLQRTCTEIFQHLRTRPNAKDWERFEIKLLVGVPRRPVLIRGFGVPDQTGREHSRVVLLLEEIARRKEEFSKDLAQRFQFTQREQEVVQCLARGWTNKEIATSLKLALPTVKEHIRHIMDKTKTNTRTGILVQVLHA